MRRKTIIPETADFTHAMTGRDRRSWNPRLWWRWMDQGRPPFVVTEVGEIESDVSHDGTLVGEFLFSEWVLAAAPTTEPAVMSRVDLCRMLVERYGFTRRWPSGWTDRASIFQYDGDGRLVDWDA